MYLHVVLNMELWDCHICTCNLLMHAIHVTNEHIAKVNVHSKDEY